MTDKHTVMLVEDDAEVRDRLASELQKHDAFELIALCASKADAIARLSEDQPEVLLVDLGLPDGSGIEIIKAIRDNKLDCQAMVISGFQDERLVFQALEAGAQSYILKHDNSLDLVESILNMINGGAPISPIIARLMLQRFQTFDNDEAPTPEVLTKRQTAILKYVSQGFSSREISEKLNLSYYTVTTHIKNIYTKLQVNSRTEALFEANRLGLLN